MSAMTNLLIKDDQATPLELTFIPITDNPSPFWRAPQGGVPIDGAPRLTLSSEKLKSGGYKRTQKTEVPVMETLGASGTSAGYVAPQKVAYTNVMITSMFVDTRSTYADAANLLKIHKAFMDGASSTTATGTLDNTAAGQAYYNSNLPGPQFFVYGTTPN